MNISHTFNITRTCFTVFYILNTRNCSISTYLNNITHTATIVYESSVPTHIIITSSCSSKTAANMAEKHKRHFGTVVHFKDTVKPYKVLFCLWTWTYLWQGLEEQWRPSVIGLWQWRVPTSAAAGHLKTSRITAEARETLRQIDWKHNMLNFI